MKYRKFGKTNETVSVLGFGAMRLPVKDGNMADIDKDKAISLIRHAIGNGVNYIDTAYPYHGTGLTSPGQSEPLVAEALKDGYREKVKIATKSPVWLIEKREDFDYYLDLQLKRLNTSYIDFYLIHALNKATWTSSVNAGFSDFLDKALESGKIKHAGFSFHDDIDTFKEIVDGYDWSFCQIQYNYLDENYQAGREGLEYAASKNLGIAIMEPLRGGALINNLPADAVDALKNADADKSTAEWAFGWLYDHKEISVVLSGMSTMDQVEENIKIAEKASAGQMSETDKEAMQTVQQIFRDRQKVDCTGCRYCMPCPAGVNIPDNFSLYNNSYLLDMNHSKMFYSLLGPKASDKCVECGMCEEHCPQNIPIREMLKAVHSTLS